MTHQTAPAIPSWRIWMMGWGSLSPKAKNQIQSLVNQWGKDGLWKLWEGCDIVFGLYPDKDARWLNPIRNARSKILLDRVEREVRVGRFTVGNIDEGHSEWWVTPSKFLEWVSARPQYVGENRANFVKSLIPVVDTLQPRPLGNENDQLSVAPDGVTTTAGVLTQSPRDVVYSSGYSNPLLEILWKTIEEFWLPTQRKERRAPKNDEIRTWLINKYPLMSDRKRRAIILLIRPDARLEGDE